MNNSIDSNSINLPRIFKLQNACYAKNRSVVPHACDFIEKCLELILNRQIKNEEFTNDEIRKFKIVHQLLDTAVSSSINGYKLIMYGCLGDATALLRVVFEACVFLDYGIEFDAYIEIENRFMLTIYGNNKLEFEKVLQDLENKEKTDRGKLFGDLSKFGSHLTAYRMSQNYFEFAGKKHAVTAHSLASEDSLRGVLGFQMRTVLYMLNLLADFYHKTKPSALNSDFFIGAEDLKKKYASLR